ncbi:hypothetical protein [Streptomyces sp. NPDC001816]|uniref:hypothetical protein n=1 Tax=Streptomyces sp. NPDC001816 TaxID=3364612 RepID=UPI0036D05307
MTSRVVGTACPAIGREVFMAWMSEEFGNSHDGFAGAVLTDGNEPKPVYLAPGSGTNFHQTSEWWAYNGKWGRPKAAAELRPHIT